MPAVALVSLQSWPGLNPTWLQHPGGRDRNTSHLMQIMKWHMHVVVLYLL